MTLSRGIAQQKFGPHYVAAMTPLNNIRLTTFFAGENELRRIDPRKLERLEAHGCRVERHRA